MEYLGYAMGIAFVVAICVLVVRGEKERERIDLLFREKRDD